MVRQIFEKKITYLIAMWGYFFLCIFNSIYYVWRNMEYALDNDASETMVLGNLLAEEGNFIFSSNWFYETELHVLDTQFIYGILFRFFDDWSIVRMLGILICWSLLFLSLAYLLQKLNLLVYFPLLAGSLLIPYEGSYCWVMLIGGQYLTRIAAVFLIMALLVDIICSKGTLIKHAILLLMVFSWGVEGLRFFLILFLPIVVVCILIIIKRIIGVFILDGIKEEFIEKDWKMIWATLEIFFASVLGYMLNMKLSNAFELTEWNNMQWKIPSTESISELMRNYFLSVGYLENVEIMSLPSMGVNAGVIYILLVIVVCTIYHIKNIDKFRYEENVILGIIVVANLLTIALYSFSTMIINVRYFSQIMVYFVVFIPLVLRKSRLKCIGKNIIVVTLCIVTIVIGYVNCYRAWGIVYNSEYKSDMHDIASFLLENDYKNGYGYQDSLTTTLIELTDGQIDVWSLEGSGENIGNESVLKWGQVKEHMDSKPTGKVFYVIKNAMLDSKMIEKGFHIAYSNDSYTVLGE